ncbi:hypothetical protein [Fibrella forsythiae]|uniref:DUF1570 domain-containing protein n=1 Tax=Fibrella forsythiae TaxID=2817061 RepID=A0ABS3JLQ2_9BACT|nr:hypothetical protein [Fibrella forsythiae]MBO0950937.1 hypothetical protein [Fibrella forsythiae]
MRRSVVRWLVLLLIALPLGTVILFPTLWRCLTIAHASNFKAVQVGTRALYISADASPRQRDVLLTHLQVASERIRRFWGNQQGQAVIIYCPTQEQYSLYCSGGEGAGCSLGMPWGASFLVLGPEGNSPDVMAHELCHDELFARLGWLTVKQQVPQWFNEGLALMVDYRFSNGNSTPRERFLIYDAEWNYRARGPQGLSPQVMPVISSLESTRDFFYGDYGRVMLAYLTAGREVSRWLATVGPTALPRLMTGLSEGGAFATVYQYARDKKAGTLQKNVPPANHPTH